MPNEKNPKIPTFLTKGNFEIFLNKYFTNNFSLKEVLEQLGYLASENVIKRRYNACTLGKLFRLKDRANFLMRFEEWKEKYKIKTRQRKPNYTYKNQANKLAKLLIKSDKAKVLLNAMLAELNVAEQQICKIVYKLGFRKLQFSEITFKIVYGQNSRHCFLLVNNRILPGFLDDIGETSKFYDKKKNKIKFMERFQIFYFKEHLIDFLFSLSELIEMELPEIVFDLHCLGKNSTIMKSIELLRKESTNLKKGIFKNDFIHYHKIVEQYNKKRLKRKARQKAIKQRYFKK